MTSPLSVVENIHVFKKLPLPTLEAISAVAQMRECVVGEALFTEGQDPEGIFVLYEGFAKVVRITNEGREVLIFLVRPGHMVGEGAVFQNSSHPATALVIKKVRALFIPFAACHVLVAQHTSFAMRMLSVLATRQRMFVHKIVAQGERNATMRVAGYIRHRSAQEGASSSVSFHVSREDLANMLGLARETVSRQLSLLAESGAIELEGRRVYIVDANLLKIKAEGG